MFNFMKKSGSGLEKDEKEKKKKEKKDRKENKKREKTNMTAEELLRLDEVRRSLKIRGRRKEKEKLPSGITADYSASFFAELNRHEDGTDGPSSQTRSEALTQSDSSETSLTSLNNPGTSQHNFLPPLPPRPPKRGILKQSPRLSSDTVSHGDSNTLIKNTLQNEVITYQNLPKRTTLEVNVGDSIEVSPGDSSSVGSGDHTLSSYLTPPVVKEGKSPSIDSLTDSATNSSFATPPFSWSPVAENQAQQTPLENGLTCELPLPKIEPIKLPKPRVLTISRQAPPRNDFGFSLRRAMVVERNLSGGGGYSLSAVIFAEPGAIVQHRNDTGLLPGDRLLEVNGCRVDDKNREEVIEMIKSSGSSVTVKVQPVSELSELSRRSAGDGQIVQLADSNIQGGTLRRSGSRRFNQAAMAKSEEQVALERNWVGKEHLWLVHQQGFSSVMGVSHNPPAVTVTVNSSGEEMVVDEDEVEKANPPTLDRAEDLAQLLYINESSALHTLRQRYAANLIHTYAAETLLIINPMAPLAIYSEKVCHMFRGCKSEDMPPHIYSVAQSAYETIISTRHDGSVVFMGPAGSGKTTNYRHTLHYLALVAGHQNKVITPEKLNAIWTLLEAFGNARTKMNNNATRFTHIFSLDFDQSGTIASASIQLLLNERWRIARRPEGESSFHVINRLVQGCEGNLRKDLMLDCLGETNPFISAVPKMEDRQKAIGEFSRLCGALTVIGVSDGEMKVIWSVIASILHLGAAGAVYNKSVNRWQFDRVNAAQRVSQLLGTTVDKLTQLLFGYSDAGSISPTRDESSEPDNGDDALQAFAVGLYSELFNVIGFLINRSITMKVHTVFSLLAVDTPGFQIQSNQSQGVGFHNIYINYLSERLNELFQHRTIVAPREQYLQEGVKLGGQCDEDEGPEQWQTIRQLLSALDRPSKSPLGRSEQESLGLFWALDELSTDAVVTDVTVVEKLFSSYYTRDNEPVIKRGPALNQITLYHCNATTPVTYSMAGWRKECLEHHLIRTAASVLKESQKKEVSELFVMSWGSGLTSSLTGSVVGIEGLQTLRKGSNIHRTATTGLKRKSFSLQLKFVVDGLVDTLKRTRIKFVQCMLPHRTAGLSDTLLPAHNSSIPPPDSLIDIPLLRIQMRGSRILDAVRLHRQGFPKFMSHQEFTRRFHLLASSVTLEDNQEKIAVEEMVQILDLDPATYRIGLNKIFFRVGVLPHLEAQRDEKLTDRVVRFQAHCRGFLARKKFAKRKVEQLAVCCIQRNVRKFLSVRNWPWWRLLVRVMPLLNVHRTEEELRAKTEELENLKNKFEKLEQEKSLLKLETSKLEAKSLFGNKYSANGTVDRSQEQSPLTAYRLRNAFRSASVANEPQVDSASGTHWKYKPLPLRRKSMASRSPSCCSTASEAESITESLTGKMDFQRSNSYNLDTFRNRNKGSYVYDRSSNFMMGLRRQSLQRLPAQQDMENTSAQLSAKISEFLQRTDHVMDEWKRLGHKEPMDFGSTRIKRSSSVSNIMIKGFRYLGRDSSKSICSTSCDVVSETDELSELTMDLAEEHSSAALANQRLKIESAEKLRLEKELNEIQKERKQLQDSSDRMELELMYSRNSEMNGTSELESEFGEEDSAYKQRYERAMRELEFTRRRLQQQHQDDLEQLIALKKQLEKKLADAYEEVEEQRQVVGQWKRKVQKLTSEMNDLRLLLEKQNSRNDMLEKKQRKFDTEIQLLTDELRQEKTSKDRAAREKELALGDKYTMEQNMSAMKLELEMKEQKINSLTAEINELSFGGNTEEEIGLLKKAKHQLTNKVKEQEEELDDLAGQVQLLETAKLRLEMSLEQIRKENKKELAQRDEELEEVRCNAHKKVKALECQLENEHEERTLLLRERHEMERKLAEYEERSHATRNSDQELLQKLRRDLKRTKALLRDAQTTIEQSRTETPNKTLIRQLRNQLEDAECARALAVKARQAAEAERSEALATLEDAVRARSEAEDRASAMMRERTQLQSQLDENEEELADVLKKYRATVQQLSNEQISLQEQAGRVAELETERASLREQLAELSTRVESMETLNDPNSSLAVKRLQLKTKELESKLELEQTTRSRLEVQINRLKENNERLQSDIEILKAREHSAQEKAKSSNRLVRELREENTLLTSKEHEAQAKIRELDKSVESAEADAAAARTDLRLALQRIEDLQCAIQGDMEDADDNSGASSDSDSSIRSDEVLNTCASLTHPGSGDSSYQSVERSSSQLRKLNDSVTKDSSLA